MKVSDEDKIKLGLDFGLDIELLDTVEFQLGMWTTIVPFIDGLPMLIAGNTQGRIVEIITSKKFAGRSFDKYNNIFIGRFFGLFKWRDYPMFVDTEFKELAMDFNASRVIVIQEDDQGKLSLQPLEFLCLDSWFGH